MLEFSASSCKLKIQYRGLLALGSLWLPPLVWAGVVFIFSSMPQVKITQLFFWDFILKKTAHISEYAILFALIFRATRGNWVKSFAVTAAYSISDEYHQSFVPGRTPSVFDLGFDLSGANISGYIIWKLKQIRQKKR